MKAPKPLKGFNFRKYLRRRKPAIDEVVREYTAGGVVWRRNPKNKEIEILLVQDAKDRWTIPKGHIEEGEKPRDTAEREIREETGLSKMKVMGWLGKINFRYRRQNSLVLINMQMYLVQALGNTGKLKKEDWMNGIKWVTSAKALELIEYEDIGKIILLGLKKIRDARL
ncbi:MAG TPA: NUDIX domain-containing protein [Candidatus Saccharibacteria bacterium]|nr:NUDIX domain-containing protein [Candidatus Saccharibacteria bacterium]